MEIGHKFLQRGWLNCNSLVCSRPGADTRVLVDTGFFSGAEALLGMLEGLPAAENCHTVVINTHVHPDHTGGNQLLQQRLGAAVWVSEMDSLLLQSADSEALMRYPGMECPAFEVNRVLTAGERVAVGNMEIFVHASPGHASGEVSLYWPETCVLACGDVLWADGFSNVVPMVEGQAGLARHEISLQMLAQMRVDLAYPGHGPPIVGRVAFQRAIESTLDRVRTLRADSGKWCASSVRSFLIMGLLTGGPTAPGAFLEACAASPWYRELIARFGHCEATNLDKQLSALASRKLVEVAANGLACTLNP